MGELKEVIKELHPYSTPLIMKIDVKDVNDEYIKWLKDVVG